MSKTRKILGILLAITLIINVFAVAANALSEEGESSTNACDWSLSSAAFTTAPAAGADFTVDVLLYTNYKTGVIQFALEYDKTVFTAKSVSAAAAYSAAFTPASVVGNGDVSGTTGLYKVSMIPTTAGKSTLPAVEFGAEDAPVAIATVTFTYNGGSGTIAIKDDYKTSDNVGGTLCAYRAANSNIICSDPDSNFVCGQTATVAAASTVGTAAATLVAKTTGTYTGAYVDEARQYVYGVPVGATPENYFQTSASGAVTFVANDAGATNGTGATVTVGSKTYTLIVFGDVNGDGAINGLDAQAIDQHTFSQNVISSTSAMFFAADVNKDDAVNGLDAQAVDQHTFSMSAISANIYA